MAIFPFPLTDSDTEQDVSNQEETTMLPRESLRLVKHARKVVMKRKGFVKEDRMKELYQQLEIQLLALRAVVPHFNSTRKPCVISDALEYKEQLKQQIEQLTCRQTRIDVSASGVEVVAKDGGLLIHVSCEKRPFLLPALMAEIEGLELAYEEVNVSCEKGISIRAFGKQMHGSCIQPHEVKRRLMHKIQEEEHDK